MRELRGTERVSVLDERVSVLDEHLKRAAH